MRVPVRRRQPFGGLPFRAAVHLTLQMLAAVEAVHQEGYVHRDVKPSNFCVMEPAAGAASPRQLCILDFGQSRVFVDEKGKGGGARTRRDTAHDATRPAHDASWCARRRDVRRVMARKAM